MAKHKNVAQAQETSILDKTLNLVQSEKMAIEDMPLESIRDYRLYNEEAGRINKRLKLCRYPYKQCPVELHPKQRITFRRNDQPTNPLPVFVSNNLIHFDELLVPGRQYDLPECIVAHLAERGDPVWDWIDLPNGERETRVVTKKPRFSLTTVYQEA